MRRFGEEIYGSALVVQQPKPSCIDSVSSGDHTSDGWFFRSSDIHVRFLSTLVILRTINQDQLAHAIDTLQNDLRTEDGRQLFLHYRALPVILSFIRPTNKLLTNSAMDIVLQMCVESSFIDTCSQSCVAAECFQKMALLWRVSSPEPGLLEKVSVFLQKLSKVRSNRKFFDMYGISTVCPEILRTHGSKSSFLSLNVKSILQNVSISK